MFFFRPFAHRGTSRVVGGYFGLRFHLVAVVVEPLEVAQCVVVAGGDVVAF